MATLAATSPAEGKFIRSNGTDIHYVEAGNGPPLVLLHGGLMSTSPIWVGMGGSYRPHMDRFAEHFRVIAPDTRGHGRTANPGNRPFTCDQLADDVLGLIDALGLDRPMICGFSLGAGIATIAAIKRPEAFRALVNDAGFDAFDPRSPSFSLMRQMLGGRPDATEPDPAAVRQFFVGYGMKEFFERLERDHDEGQGPGSWQRLVIAMFESSTRSPGYTFEDLRRITAPTLVLTGDRDMACSVEDAVTSFRMLSKGQLAILPGQGHSLPDAAIQLSVEFLETCRASPR